MRLATWNINSVRLRIDLVTGFLRDHDIDVLCLQETKTEDQHFPAKALSDAKGSGNGASSGGSSSLLRSF